MVKNDRSSPSLSEKRFTKTWIFYKSWVTNKILSDSVKFTVSLCQQNVEALASK